MPARLFVTVDPDAPDRGRLEAQGARHLRALHLKVGDSFIAIVGPRAERAAAIVALDRGGAICELGLRIPESGADPSAVRVLAIGVAELSRMDLVVEKATELGATEIRPFRAARSQLGALARGRLERWERIALAACEQCGRTSPPEISPPSTFDALVGTISGPGAAFVFAPDGEPRPQASSLERARSHATLVVGPEGGLTPEEVTRLVTAGAGRIRLGPRILRCETAAVAALASLDAWLAQPT